MRASGRALRLMTTMEQRIAGGARTQQPPKSTATRTVLSLHSLGVIVRQQHRASSSCMAVAEDPFYFEKHCTTCTCDPPTNGFTVSAPPARPQEQVPGQTSSPLPAAATSCPFHDEQEQLPPPLPDPIYSVRRRVLPRTLCPLNSSTGRRYLLQALENHTAASYIPLTEHFCNQSDPAYCGITTLLIVLNALSVDPGIRWKGGWRYFGSEDVLLAQCCLQRERIQRVGISMDEFAQLGACHGLQVTMKRAKVTAESAKNNNGGGEEQAVLDEREEKRNIDEFRQDLSALLQEAPLDEPSSLEDNDYCTASTQQRQEGIVVVSFSRAALGQTGDGHFSPIAAYHAATDQVLVLDVARFKYQPYWVTVSDLYRAMVPLDSATEQPRGWYLLRPPVVSASYKGRDIQSEERRPVHLVPAVGQYKCPVHPIKVDFCQIGRRRRSTIA